MKVGDWLQGWKLGVVLVAALVVISFIAVEVPGQKPAALDPTASGRGGGVGIGDPDETIPGAEGVAAAGEAIAGGGIAGTPGAAVAGPGGAAGPVAGATGANCKAGANGGTTDTGVTGDRIRLAATNVRSGVGSSFLGTAYVGMQAVVNRVNARGGVCGRLLELRLVDDGWDAARGATFIQNFIKEGYFALPVVPSSEGLTQAISNGTIRQAGIPVVGSDGMLKEQYQDPWVWPVATATVSTMRIMARHAADQGAKTFGIVYDRRYRFGVEGAAAFRDYVRQLTGKDPSAFVGIEPQKSDYAGDAQKFNSDCGSKGCDFVALLLDPVTANAYLSSQTEREGRLQGLGTMLTGGAQPLFNDRFARDCGRKCDGVLVWTGYNPPIGGLASRPDIAGFVNDVRSVDPGVDVNNQFLLGAYLGMQVFVRALEAVGGTLTRAALAQALEGLQFQSDLASPLDWAPGQRFANLGAQAFRITTASGSFAGFAEVGTGFLRDPNPGKVPT